ncbi:hypothetical protein D3C75_1106200 [compost metagenome]
MQLVFVITQYAVEHVHCRIRQPRVCNPGAVVAVAGLQLFVGLHFVQHLAITFAIFAGNERRHSAHRKSSALMAGFDQQTRIGIEE